MRSRRTLAVLASPWVSLFSAGCGAVAVYEASRLKQKKRELLSLLHDAAGICSVAGQAAPHTFKDVCYGSGAEPAVCVFQGVGHPEILSAAKVAAIAAGITPDAVSLSQLAAGVAAADVFLTAQSTRTVSNLFFRSSRQGYSSGPGASVSPEATDIGSREEEKDDECRGCLPSYSSPVQGKGVSVGRVVSARVVRKPLEFSWSHGLRWPRRFLRIKYQYFVPYTGKEKDAAPRESSTSGRDSGSEGAVQPSFLVGTDRVLPVTARILGKRDQGQGYTRFADHGTSQTVSEDIPGTSEVSTQHLQRRESGKAAQWSILSWFNFWSYFRARSREEYPKLQGQQSPDILFNIYEGTAELRLAPGDGPRADNEETVSVRPPPGTVADHRLRAVEQIDPTCGPVAPPEGQCGPANQVCAARPPPAEPATKVTRSSLHGRYISHTPATPANVTQLKEEGESSPYNLRGEGFLTNVGEKRASSLPGGGVSVGGAVPARLKTAVQNWSVVQPQELIIVSYERQDPENHTAWVALVPEARAEPGTAAALGSRGYPGELVVLTDDTGAGGDFMMFGGGALVFMGVLKSYIQLVLKKRLKISRP